MIEIPPGFSKKTFRQLFVPGALFFCKNYNFSERDTKPKYILVLNGCDQSDSSHFYLPTSQVEKYRKISIYANLMYTFPHGAVEAFSRETAIIIPNVQTKTYQYFERKYLRPSTSDYLNYCEKMPDHIMSNIYKMIVASRKISLEKKRKILPPEFFASG